MAVYKCGIIFYILIPINCGLSLHKGESPTIKEKAPHLRDKFLNRLVIAGIVETFQNKLPPPVCQSAVFHWMLPSKVDIHTPPPLFAQIHKAAKKSQQDINS